MSPREAEMREELQSTAVDVGFVDPAAQELLMAIVRLSREVKSQSVSQLAGKVRDWDSFLDLAGIHGITSFAYSYLRRYGVELPPAVETRLRVEFERNAVQCFINAAELVSILDEFSRAMIPVLPYKGVALAASIYGDLAARPAGDLDLLVRREHLVRASEVLVERGFTRLTHIHEDGTPIVQGLHEYQFERASDGLLLELRWKLDLDHPGFTRNLNMDWLLPNTCEVNFAGARIQQLKPEMTLVVLCMHGSKHGWPRLIWILDVAQLLTSFPSLDWDEVIRLAGRSGLSKTLALGVILAHRVVGVKVPENLLHRFTSNSTISALARDIEQALFEFSSDDPASRTGYKVQLLQYGDRIRYLLTLGPLKPNEEDRAALPLPKPLHGLYYLIRPFRILWNRREK
jgi:hypothetical protein